MVDIIAISKSDIGGMRKVAANKRDVPFHAAVVVLGGRGVRRSAGRSPARTLRLLRIGLVHFSQNRIPAANETKQKLSKRALIQVNRDNWPSPRL
jgi:hypothetical protein